MCSRLLRRVCTALDQLVSHGSGPQIASSAPTAPPTTSSPISTGLARTSSSRTIYSYNITDRQQHQRVILTGLTGFSSGRAICQKQHRWYSTYNSLFEKQYTELHEYVKSHPLMMTLPNLNARLPGESILQDSAYMMTETGKVFTHSMLKCIFDVHQSGRCFINLKADDLHVNSLGWVEIKEGVELERINIAIRRLADYHGGSNILSGLMRVSHPLLTRHDLPPDLRDLFKCMRVQGEAYALVHHGSLLLLPRKQEVVLRMYDLCILAASSIWPTMPYGQTVTPNWKQLLSSNPILNQWLQYRVNCNRPFTCTEHNFITCLRHMYAHRMDYASSGFGMYTAEEHARLLSYKVPLVWVTPLKTLQLVGPSQIDILHSYELFGTLGSK